jgi:hypothetical protein
VGRSDHGYGAGAGLIAQRLTSPRSFARNDWPRRSKWAGIEVLHRHKLFVAAYREAALAPSRGLRRRCGAPPFQVIPGLECTPAAVAARFEPRYRGTKRCKT